MHTNKRLPFHRFDPGSYDYPTHEMPYYIGRRNLPAHDAGVTSPHVHGGIEAGMVISGQGVLYLDGQTYELAHDDCYFTNAMKPHGAASTVQGEMLYQYAHINIEALASVVPPGSAFDMMQILLSPPENAATVLRNRKDIVDIFSTAHDSFHGKNHFDMIRAWSFVLRGLVMIAEEILPGTTKPNSPAHHAMKKPVLEAVNFIHHQYAEPITLQHIAAHCSVSPSHLSHLFTEIMQYSPIEYRNKVRIDNAIRLLLDTDEKIEKIASDTGFESISYFYTLFRRITSKSPAEIRSCAH